MVLIHLSRGRKDGREDIPKPNKKRRRRKCEPTGEKSQLYMLFGGGGENDWVAGFTSKMLCVFIRVYIHEQEQVGGWVGGWSFASLLLLGACVSVRRHGTGGGKGGRE